MIEPEVERSDEFLAGAEWFVAATPGGGQRFETSSIWTLSFEIPDGRTATLYYSFDRNYVYFLSITIMEST